MSRYQPWRTTWRVSSGNLVRRPKLHILIQQNLNQPAANGEVYPRAYDR